MKYELGKFLKTCIINAGISRVVYKEGYPDEFSIKLFDEAGVKLEKFPELG